MKKWAVGLVALLAVAGCGGDSEDGDTAVDFANAISKEVDSVTKVVEITEDNDPNDAIGRPGSYTSAASLYDSRAECDTELDITCGAKLEVFATATAAKERKAYIQALVEGSAGLVTEYDYLDGPRLLRVSGALKPSEAEEYEQALG